MLLVSPHRLESRRTLARRGNGRRPALVMVLGGGHSLAQLPSRIDGKILTDAIDLTNADYRIMRLQQLAESRHREIRSLEKRLSDASYDCWVLRGDLADLTRQESCVVNPLGATDSAYGMELTMDLYGCDVATFTRDSLGSYFDHVCALIGVTPEQRHFWDDVGVQVDERQTNPKTQGTSAVQFILTSTIVIHTLDQLEQVFVNVFSCGNFDAGQVQGHSLKHFGARCLEPHVIVRG